MIKSSSAETANLLSESPGRSECHFSPSLKKKNRNRWDNEKYAEFRTNIESDNINKLKNKILGVKQMIKSKSDINSLADDLCQICIESAKTTFGTKLSKNKKIIL